MAVIQLQAQVAEWRKQTEAEMMALREERNRSSQTSQDETDIGKAASPPMLMCTSQRPVLAACLCHESLSAAC